MGLPNCTIVAANARVKGGRFAELAPQLDDLMAASCLVEPKIEKLESALNKACVFAASQQ